MAVLPRDVLREIERQTPKEFGKQLEKIAREKFEIIKNEMLDEFEQHPITIELEAGESSKNTSGTLSGYGNLFTFIGFPSGYDPLGEVRLRLNQTILKKIGFSKGRLNFITTEPTREALFKITKFSDFRNDFEGSRSWLDGIETGISGLGFYLYIQGKDFEDSRSGPAIQLKGGKKSESALGGGSTGGAILSQRTRYKRTSYISGILRRFREKTARLQNLKI